MTQPSGSDLAAYLDHTLLAVGATDAEVGALCADGVRLNVAAICVSPTKVAVANTFLKGAVPIASVVGFPSGAHRSEAKALEASLAVSDGASEIDMVVNLGLVADAKWDEVEADIAAVRAAVPHPTHLKVIIESASLTDAEIVACCECAERAGADFVKTSTGFHPAGGSSVEAVTLMARTVGGRLGVKASGGIRTAEAAKAVIEAGATRIGTSSSEAILGLT